MGEMLRALVIASNDYIPPNVGDPLCHDKQEAQFYRVIRQKSIRPRTAKSPSRVGARISLPEPLVPGLRVLLAAGLLPWRVIPHLLRGGAQVPAGQLRQHLRLPLVALVQLGQILS